MKFLVLIAAIILSIVNIKCDSGFNIREGLAELRKEFLEVAEEQCYPNSTEGLKRFTELLDNSTICLANVYNRSPIFVTPLKTLKENMQNCLNDFLDEMEEHLPEGSKDWPQLNLDIVYSLLEFIYENKEQLTSPKVTSFGQKCLVELAKEFENSKCLDFFDSDNFDVKVQCQDLLGVYKCLAVAMNKKCPADEPIDNLKLGFLESLREPCREFEGTDRPVAAYVPPNMNPDLM